MEHTKKRIRCAVYTRKSTEEGLEQDFNSIDAQRDAGHAYIASQRAEGWTPVADDYDDPAFSGGNMDRPAMLRLLRDIKAGVIDVVVVYRIDRLTRSLMDFSRMVEVFEQHHVSFVSVTQQFNTTSSMGRLMLNILLSFAQFEREQTGERIRDKIKASKKKGLWMGGIPPLGYDVKDRMLLVNVEEAKTVERIFMRFTAVGSATKLCQEFREDGMTSKSWTTQDGRHRPGKPIDRGMIYKILHNRTYLGELRHKEDWYDGVHDAIIGNDLWDDAHAILASNGHSRGNRTKARVPFLLKGIVVGEDGRALTCWSSSKRRSGQRYRYYVSTREGKEFAGASGLPRIPAAELEATVMTHVRRLLQASPITQKAASIAQQHGVNVDEAQVCVALSRIDPIWEQLFPEEQSRIVRLLIDKVVVTPTAVDLRLRKNGLEQFALELTGSYKNEGAA